MESILPFSQVLLPSALWPSGAVIHLIHLPDELTRHGSYVAYYGLNRSSLMNVLLNPSVQAETGNVIKKDSIHDFIAYPHRACMN